MRARRGGAPASLAGKKKGAANAGKPKNGPMKGRRKGQGPGAQKANRIKDTDGIRDDDVYEADLPEVEGANRPGRYDSVENYEYEMPSDFEDEEIDEDSAFTAEDKRLYAEWFPPSEDEEEEFDDPYGLIEKGGDEEDDDEGAADEEDDDPYGLIEKGGDDEDDLADEDDEDQRPAMDWGGDGMLAVDEDAGDDKKGDDGDDDDDDDDDGSEEDDDDDEEEDEDDELFAGWGGDEEDGDEEGAMDEDGEEDEGAHERMLAALRAGKKGPHRAAVVSEAQDEDAYNLNPDTSTAGASQGSLSVSRLLEGLGKEGRKGLGSARKELEKLEKTAAPVDAPLPSNISRRLEREAAYEDTKKDISKWQSIVKANREAPTLKFEGPREGLPKIAVSTTALAASFKPENDLEAEVAAMLEAAGAHDGRAVEEVEEALALKKLTVEEAQERRGKLAKMRSLLFYHETKAKHLKKIKSKEYHRKLKKDEKRKALKAGEAGDADGDDEDNEDIIRIEAEKAALDRAKERISLKHKNSSRWARRALKRGQMNMDEGTKEAIAEQLRIGQELRRKAERMGRRKGKDSDDSEDDSTDASDSDEDDDGEGGPGGQGGTYGGARSTAKAKATALEILEAAGAPAEGEVATKGLFALPFMQRALQKKRAEAEAVASSALAEIVAEGMAADKGLAPGSVEAPMQGGFAGRMSFGKPSATRGGIASVAAADGVGYGYESDEDDDGEDAPAGLDDSVNEDDAPRSRAGRKAVSKPKDPNDGEEANEPHDEIQAAERSSKSSGRVSLKSGSAHETISAKSGSAVKGKQAETTFQDNGDRPHARAFDAAPRSSATKEAETTPTKDGQEASFVKSPKFKGAKPGYVFKAGKKGVGYYRDSKAKQKQVDQEDEDRSGNHKQASANRRKSKDPGVVMLAGEEDDEGGSGEGRSQQDLIRMAFAGDDVEAEFAEAKRAEVEAELPEVDTPNLMPGWGTWSNQQREPKWMREQRQRAEQARKTAAAARADSKKAAVVISEKWDKKATKYTVESVPHGYGGSKQAYEAARRHPLGREFNTDSAFRDMTRPAILKSTGVLIDPVKFNQAASPVTGAKAGKKRDAAGPRGSKDLVKRARLRQ